MSTDRSPASLTSFAPGGESNPANVLFDKFSTTDTSQTITVLHEPVRVVAFNLTGGAYMQVEQLANINGELHATPFSLLDTPVTLTESRTSILLEMSGYYRLRLVNGTPGLSSAIALPFTMSHEMVWSSIGAFIPGLVEQLERVLEGLELHISTAPNNIIVKLADGLYAEKTFVTGGVGIEVTGVGSALAPYVIDLLGQVTDVIGGTTPTATVTTVQNDLGNGLVSFTITSDVRVSSRGNNHLFEDDDGLFALQTYVSRGFGTDVTGDGDPSNPYVISAPCCATAGEIIGFVCISPTISDPGGPGGLDSSPARFEDVVLSTSGATNSDIEKTLHIVLRDIKQNGGTGGPYLVDFTNVRVNALLYEGLVPRAVSIESSNGLTQIVEQGGIVSRGYTLKVGAYDLSKNGWAGIRVAAGSYITISELNGPVSRKFYIPTGGEGFSGCGDFAYAQPGYSDSYSILVRADLTSPRATLAITPSTAVPGDIIYGGGATQLNDVALATMSLESVRLAVRVSNFIEDDGLTVNGPYAVSFDNVAFDGFFQQTSGSIVDRTLYKSEIHGPMENIAGGVDSMTFVAIEVVPDTVNYDATSDGYAGCSIAPGSFVMIQNGDGVVQPLFVPSGSEGVAPPGAYLAPQAAYEDTFFIQPAGTPPATVSDVEFNLVVAPSTLDLSTPVSWSDFGPGGPNTTAAEVAHGFVKITARNITGARPPYSVDFSNIVVEGNIKNNKTGEIVGVLSTTFVGGGADSSVSVRTGVQSVDDVHMRIDPLFSPSHSFSNTNDYGITFRVRGPVVVRDSGIGGAQKQRVYYVPSNKSEGTLVSSDTMLATDPSPGNFYIESYSYRGYVAPVAPITGRICIGPSVATPIQGVTGFPNLTLDFTDTAYPARGEVELRVYISSLVGPNGTQFTAQLKNDDNNEPFEIFFANETDGVITPRDFTLLRTNSASSGGSFAGSNPGVYFGAKLVAGTGANEFDVSKNGLVYIGLRENSYVEVFNGATSTKFYTPGGTEATVACNAAPGLYRDSFTVLGTDAIPVLPVTADLAITPSVGLPDGGATELVTPVYGPTTGGTGASAMKKIGLKVQNITGGAPPYTVDFSGVLAKAKSTLVYNSRAPVAQFCTNPAPPATTADIVMESFEFCGYDEISFSPDGMYYVVDQQGQVGDLSKKWHKNGVLSGPSVGQYQVKASYPSNYTDAGVEVGSPLVGGSSPLDTWLDIPYMYPTDPPNEELFPVWRVSLDAALLLALVFEFRAKNTLTLLGSATTRLNIDPAVGCGSGSPGGGDPTNPLPPERPPYAEVFNVLADGTDSLVGISAGTNLFPGVGTTGVQRDYQMSVRSCATWSDTLVTDLAIELSGYVTITDSANRVFVLHVPTAAEGNVGVTRLTSAPTGVYTDTYQYRGAMYTLVRPAEGTRPLRMGFFTLYANDGRIRTGPIYHDPENQTIGQWFPAGQASSDYMFRVTVESGDTESAATGPLNVWTKLGSSSTAKYSAEGSTAPNKVVFKVEVRNALNEITTWYIKCNSTSNQPATSTLVSYSPIPL